MNSRVMYFIGAAIMILGVVIIFEPIVLLYLAGIAMIVSGMAILYITRKFSKSKKLVGKSFHPFLIIQEYSSDEEDEEEKEWPPFDIDSIH